MQALDDLAVLDTEGNLSEIGIIASELPLDPQMAKGLWASCELQCVSQVATTGTMLPGEEHLQWTKSY